MLARSPEPEAHDKVLEKVFTEREKLEYPEQGARKRTNNKLNPHMTPCSGIEPGTHWWGASALASGPSLHPIKMAGVPVKKDLKRFQDPVLKAWLDIFLPTRSTILKQHFVSCNVQFSAVKGSAKAPTVNRFKDERRNRYQN